MLYQSTVRIALHRTLNRLDLAYYGINLFLHY